MSKTCIITISQGDFDYIKEWIEWHHNIGVDLIIIGYNGHPDNFYKMPKYDYVRYIDFSTNNNSNTLDRYFDYSKHYGNFVMLQDKLINILYKLVLTIFIDYKYCFFIDSDEYVNIENTNYTNISSFLDSLTDIWLVKHIYMKYYTDNNLIYKDDRPLNERFTEGGQYLGKGKWETKQVFNLSHFNAPKVEIHSVHLCNFSEEVNEKNTININNLSLKHFRHKTLEEHIFLSCNENNKERNRKLTHLFSEFFTINKITDEKLKAIPELLKKYNKDYDVTLETNINFIYHYIKYFNTQYSFKEVLRPIIVTVITNENDLINIDKWVTYHYNLGIYKIYIGLSKHYDNMPKYDYVNYIISNETNETDIYNDIIFNTIHINPHTKNDIFNIFVFNVNQYLEILDTTCKDISEVLIKHFNYSRCTRQIETYYYKDNNKIDINKPNNERCKIVMNNKHWQMDQNIMITPNYCKHYSDGAKINKKALILNTYL